MTLSEMDKTSFLKKTMTTYSTVVVLNHIKQYGLVDLSFPSYFKDELKIDDAKVFLRRLTKRGYLHGKNSKQIRVSEKGEHLISEHQDYLNFFNLAIPYVEVVEYQTKKEQVKKENKFEAIMILLLLEKTESLKKADDYEGVKNLHFEIGNLYKSMGYFGQAAYHYITAVYFEVSGLEFYDKFIRFMEGKYTIDDLRGSYEYMYIDPNVIKEFEDVKDVYYDDMVDTVYDKNKISINMCSKEMFKKMIKDIAEGQFNRDRWQGYFHSAFNALVRAVENRK